MLFVIILTFILYFFIRKSKRKAQLITFIIFIFFVYIIFLLIFQWEIGEKNPQYYGNYGSDSYIYYNEALNINDSGDITNYSDILNRHAGIYYLLNALIIRFSPTPSVIYIKIFNIFIFMLTIVLVVLMLEKHYSLLCANIFLLITSINGLFIIYSIKNLRDILLLFLYVILIYLLDRSAVKKQAISKLIIMITVLFVLYYLRLQSFIISLLVIYFSFILNANKKTRLLYYLLLPVAIICICYFLIPHYEDISRLKFINITIERLQNYTSDQLANKDVLNYFGTSYFNQFIIGSIRLVFFPIPLNFYRYFILEYIESNLDYNVINILRIESSFLTYFMLFIILINVTYIKSIFKNKFILLFFIVVIFHQIIYGIVYLGGGDPRHKIYFIFFICLLSSICITKKITRLSYGK